MRIYQTKHCLFLSESSDQLKKSMLNSSKFLSGAYLYSDGNNCSSKRWDAIKDDSKLSERDQKILKATRSFMSKEIPLSKYKLEYDLDLRIDNAQVIYYRIKKGIHYMILTKIGTKLRVAYKGIPSEGNILMESISGYEFMEANKIKGMDYNFIKATRTVPTLILEGEKVIPMRNDENRNLNDYPMSLTVKRGYESKLTQLLMEQGANNNKLDTDWL